MIVQQSRDSQIPMMNASIKNEIQNFFPAEFFSFWKCLEMASNPDDECIELESVF